MRKIISIFITTLLLSSTGYSKNVVVDIYGAGEKNTQAILDIYSKKIIALELASNKEILLEASGKENAVQMKKIDAERVTLEEHIKKFGAFLFVHLHTTIYPGDENLYTTLEIVEKNRPNRLRFVNTENQPHQSQVKSDLITKMIDYGNTGSRLFLEKKLIENDYTCPVYHCTYGFNHHELRAYLAIFNKGAIKEKNLIVDTLNNDPDPERRAAAAFLIGHFNDPKEIISILIKHIDDKSALVRNNVMRVIGDTMSHAKIYQINIIPFLDILDSPYGTDRNKALNILFEASKADYAKKLIMQKGKDNLIAILRLKQPNNHEYAYLILKNISGKDFGENNIDAWKKWLAVS